LDLKSIDHKWRDIGISNCRICARVYVPGKKGTCLSQSARTKRTYSVFLVWEGGYMTLIPRNVPGNVPKVVPNCSSEYCIILSPQSSGTKSGRPGTFLGRFFIFIVALFWEMQFIHILETILPIPRNGRERSQKITN